MRQVRKLAKQILPDPMVDFIAAVEGHMRRHGAFPRLRRPQTFSEKIAHRKIFDRRPLLTLCADKYAVRDFVASRLGPDVLAELYYVTKNPAEIPFATLPDKFVIKPTHGSGWGYIVTDKSQIDVAKLMQECRAWLSQSFYEIGREWPYKNIEPRIIIEEYVDDGGGNKAPTDYKFFVFDGKVALIQVDIERFATHRRGLYDRNWNQVDVRVEYPPLDAAAPRPKHLVELIRAAETVCKGIDFIRADFYDTERKIYFGELTTTPESGLAVFDPATFDSYLGGLWRLPGKRHN
jgi:hypothetical protein